TWTRRPCHLSTARPDPCWAAPLRSDADVRSYQKSDRQNFERWRVVSTAVSFSSVNVGDQRTEEFPALTRTMFVKYAGASGDFNPMHHDDTIASQVGNPSVFGHGMLSMGLAARVVKDWFGPEAIRRLQVRFAKQVWPGDMLTCVATVTGTREENGETLVDLDLSVTNHNGDRAISGAATVVAS